MAAECNFSDDVRIDYQFDLPGWEYSSTSLSNNALKTQDAYKGLPSTLNQHLPACVTPTGEMHVTANAVQQVSQRKRSGSQLENPGSKRIRLDSELESDGNYLEALNRLLPGLEYQLVRQEGPPHAPKFTYQVTLATPTLTFTESGPSKKRARNNLARSVLAHFVREPLPLDADSSTLSTSGVQPTDSVSAHAVNSSTGCGEVEPSGDEPWRTPACVLHEQDAALLSAFDVSECGRDAEGPLFEATVILPAATGTEPSVLRQVRRSKKEAKQALALAVLRACFPHVAPAAGEAYVRRFEQPPERPLSFDNSAVMRALNPSARTMRLARRFEAAVTNMFAQAVQSRIDYALRKHAVLAAVAVTRSRTHNGSENESESESNEDNDDELEVVALTTGSKCIRSASLRADGRAINDCHAEVLARRVTLRRCYEHIEQLLTESRAAQPNPLVLERNWFELVPESAASTDSSSDCFRARVQLKPGVNFHLFVSTAPCGDARVFFQSAVGARQSGGPGMSQREEDDDANASRPASPSSSAWQPTQASTSYSFRSLYTSFEYSKRSESESARGESEPVIASDNVQPTEDTHALRKSRSLLRAKIEDGEGTIPTLRCAPLGTGVTFEQSLDALQARERERGSRLLTMCCSDKLLKWQTAGFSGALLSHLLVKPLFFHSVVVGAPASAAHLARALFSRVQRNLDVSAPHIAVVPRTEGAEADPDPAKSASKAGKFSIVLLSRGDGADYLEVLKSRFGYVVAAETRGDSTHNDDDWMEIDRDAEGCQQMARTSCISSFALATHFARIRDLLVGNTCTRNSTPGDAPPSLPSCATTHLASSYRQLKQASSEYTLRKTTFYNTLSELHLGSWVKKPACLSDWLLTPLHGKSDAPHDAAD